MSDLQAKIDALQQEILAKQNEIKSIRKEMPLKEIKNYLFQTKNGETTSLIDLFGDKDELLLIHYMGKSCKYCTMWADGMRGYNQMLSDKMRFVLTSPDEPAVMKEFAENRDWNFDYFSYHKTSFAHDLGFAKDDENERTWYHPGVSALVRKDGKIYRSGKDVFEPGDSYCPPWHFFDLFPEGTNGWEPKYKY